MYKVSIANNNGFRKIKFIEEYQKQWSRLSVNLSFVVLHPMAA